MKLNNFKVGLLIVIAGIVGVVVTAWEWTIDSVRAIFQTLWGWLGVRWFWVALALALAIIYVQTAKGYDSDTVVYPAGARVVVDRFCTLGIGSVEYSFQALDTIQHRYRIAGMGAWPNDSTLGYVARLGSSDLITTTAHAVNQPGSVILWGLGCDAPAPPIYSADYESYAPVVLSSDQAVNHSPYPTPSP